MQHMDSIVRIPATVLTMGLVIQLMDVVQAVVTHFGMKLAVKYVSLWRSLTMAIKLKYIALYMKTANVVDLMLTDDSTNNAWCDTMLTAGSTRWCDVILIW